MGRAYRPTSGDLTTPTQTYRESRRMPPDALRAAQLLVYRRSTGLADCVDLLQMLGLYGDAEELSMGPD